MKILMTDGTSSSARQSLYGLGGGHEIDVCAPSALCQCRFSSRVRRWRRCPPLGSQPEAYLAFLVRQIRRGGYDLLLPTHEEVYLLSKFRDDFAPRVGLAVPPFAAMRKMMGKIEFAHTMDSLSLPTPPSTAVSLGTGGAAYDRYPFYLKLNYATAGLGVRLIRGPHEWQKAMDDFRRTGLLESGANRALVQQPATGAPCVVQAVFQEGRMCAAHCAEVLALGVGGGAMVRVGVRHADVVEHVRQLGHSLQWHGAMFLEYLYDDTAQRPCYIECNPRIGEPVNAQLSGVNLVDLLARISRGERIDEGQEPVIGVRSYVGFIQLIAAAIEGASRGELWRLWRSMRRGDGIYRDAANEMTRPTEDPLSRIPATFVINQLLFRPSSAIRLVEGTVNNYSLPAAAVRAIDAMSDDRARQLFAKD